MYKGLISNIYKQLIPFNNLITKWAEELNRNFSKEEMQMANRQRKLNITDYRGNASQNHTDIAPHTCQNGYHQKEHHKCWRGRAEKGILTHCSWECKLGQPVQKTVWRLLEKLKIELSYDPATLLLDISEKAKNTNLKRHIYPNVHGSIICNC